MELNTDKAFDAYVESYKKLPLIEKKKIIEKEFKEIIGTFYGLINRYNVNPKVLFNREILDLNKEEFTEDDFAEAVFVYIYTVKELIGNYVDVVERNE